MTQLTKSAGSLQPVTAAQVEVSVVMPCLNEARTLGVCIQKALKSLEENGVRGEVVIADNGSTDGSQEIAVQHGARVVPVAEKGYGNALRAGIEAALGKYVIMGDSDDSYDFTNLMPFILKLREGYDLVMGNRFRGGIKPGAMPPLHRYLGNPVLSFIGRLFFRVPAKDFHCGLRGFSKDAAARMSLQTTGMEFASEMVVKAALFHMRIAEVPTTLSPDGRDRAPHLRSWRDGWRHLRFLLMYSPRWLFLYPGVILMIVGLLLGGLLAWGPLHLAGVTLDVHTLVFAGTAVLVGFNMVVFSILARVFATQARLMLPSPILERLFKRITLEVGVIVGSVLLVAGLLGSVTAVTLWSRQEFGPLDPTVSLRIVVPSAIALAMGTQTILSSFFLSILGLQRRTGE